MGRGPQSYSGSLEPVGFTQILRALRRVLHDVRHLLGFMYLTLLYVVLQAGIDMTAPLIVRKWLMMLTGEGGGAAGGIMGFPTMVVLVAAAIMSLHIIRAVLATAENYVAHRLGWGGVCHMRTLAFEHLQEMSPGFFESKQTGELASRIITDLFDVEQLLAHHITRLITSVLTFIGVGVILLCINWRIALVSMLPIPFFIYYTRRFHQMAHASYRKLRHRQGQLSQISQETLSGIPTVQSFTMEETQSEKFNLKNVNFLYRAMNTSTIAGTYLPWVDLLVRLGNVLVILFGGILVMRGMMTFPDLFVFILYMGSFYTSAQTINTIGEPLQRCLSGLSRIYEVLDTPPQIVDRSGALAPYDITPEVEFHNVHFSYNENGAALAGINLKAVKGKTLALVGPSGGGKTTITRLVCRFYDPDGGSVRIGGHDVRDLKLPYLRSLVSLVSQDVFLFSDSIGENIRYGRPDASDDEVENAARMANAHDFIMATENGYNTYVGERGIRLSGGQKQRISIARAILKDAPILILDEATSSVDVESEALIQEALKRLCENRTTIVIAHRLSTIIHADQIAVIERGKVVEVGTHEELLRRGGLYTRLSRQSAIIA